jgi:hypothetical protein
MINAPAPAAAGKSKSETCVPLKALSVDGTPPAEGDEVEFTTKGKVTRVDGEHAYVEAAEVNGEPFSAPSEPTPEEDDEETMRIARDADAANA